LDGLRGGFSCDWTEVWSWRRQASSPALSSSIQGCRSSYMWIPAPGQRLRKWQYL
jgi:hypothetical protein